MSLDGSASERRLGAQAVRRAYVIGPVVNMGALIVRYRKWKKRRSYVLRTWRFSVRLSNKERSRVRLGIEDMFYSRLYALSAYNVHKTQLRRLSFSDQMSESRDTSWGWARRFKSPSATYSNVVLISSLALSYWYTRGTEEVLVRLMLQLEL